MIKNYVSASEKYMRKGYLQVLIIRATPSKRISASAFLLKLIEMYLFHQYLFSDKINQIVRFRIKELYFANNQSLVGNKKSFKCILLIRMISFRQLPAWHKRILLQNLSNVTDLFKKA